MPEKERNIDLKKNRIRAFFLTLEGKHKKEKGSTDSAFRDIEKEGMTYIQMRLPVEKITEEFENILKKKIEHNILHAEIRIANHEDLESLMHIYNRAWLTSNTPFRPITVEAFELIAQDPDVNVLIAKVYGTDAGFVILDFEGDNKEIGVIAGLGVIPRFQRRGLGTIMGMAAWQYLKEHYNIKELRCEVYEDNHVSQAFIKGIGFEPFGEKTYTKEDFI
ncbi:MAG: GNAT family N-acetyltransferase [Promethearchaeota archaeon]